MTASSRVETWLLNAVLAAARRQSWQASLHTGARLGDLVHALGIRRAVAAANIRRAFPDRDASFHASILREHYRELGRVALEYARLPQLVYAPAGEVFAEVSGLEHLERLDRDGRPAILLTGHFGNFELAGAMMGRVHALDFVVKPMSNPGAERTIRELRAAAGVGQVSLGAGLRDAYRALRHGRWLAMLADQDARRRGVFVPFMGTPCSTPIGPARLSIRTGAPIVMGFATRLGDGRHRLDVDAPMAAADPRAPDAEVELTRRHVSRLEDWVRRHPEQWFWVHRRWKTRPPAAARED